MSASPRLLGLALAMLAGTVGCASVKSTFLERDPSTNCWVPSSMPVDGIPVTLAVPSYVKVQLIKRYWYNGATALQTQNVGLDGKTITQVPLVTYDFKHEVIQEKKVVVVDFKRPASGTFQFSATIDKDTGYFTQVAHQGEDTTIATIGNQVNSLLGTILKGGRTSNGVVPPDQAGITFIESVVSTVFLKVTDPDFDEQLRHFVCCSLEAALLSDCGCQDAHYIAPGISGHAVNGSHLSEVSRLPGTGSRPPELLPNPKK
jgi:hypothetical protein